MSRERRRVYFSGWVQGVGFRYTCQRLSHGFEIGGYVRNLPDGRVELVAEGTQTEIDSFLSAIGRELDACIRAIDVQTENPSEQSPKEFTILPS
jgi:acylphosphatase